MAFEILDPQAFTDNGMFAEDEFLQRAESHDWARFADKNVLVRGCGGAPVPPWAFMHLTARLVGLAKSVRYGNEHDNIVVYRAARTDKK